MAPKLTAFTTASDWGFPFPAPGRPRPIEPGGVPPPTAWRWPYRALDPSPVPNRGVPAPVPLADFKREMATWCDDVGIVSIDDPAIAHERDEILYVYPHARSLVCMIGEENKAAMQSRYLPTANHELYSCEERLFAMGHRTVKYIQSLGGAGLTTTIGWPQEVSQRWADKIWPLSHKLVAQAAGLGVIGTSRNFLHRKFGAYCLIDTVVTNLEWPTYDQPTTWNPCLTCNLCVASCPTDAIRSDGTFDFFACYNHTYRDSIPGFLDLVGDLAERSTKDFRKRWADNEIAALWQAMAFKVEYRCFNCVATCPAEIEDAFQGDRRVRREYLDETLKPLTHTRGVEDAQFVLDTPSARARYDIPPGEWRTPIDRAGESWRGVRLVNLRRIRTQNVEAMMRWMPQYFRPSEAAGLAFTVQLDLTGPGGGPWVMRVADERCEVRPGRAGRADLTIRTRATYWLAVHRGDVNPVLGLVTGRLRLSGDRRLFLKFPALFGHEPGRSWAHRLAWRVRRLLRRAERRA
ncbi:MAG TPA: SCP2 sterol-binding domain-containing protein [Candidatus Eisenbacteria bacterium]|nr:SCP2 sterol-binding domain-containing protein [Candidatus Eisenbacteria bacterium]